MNAFHRVSRLLLVATVVFAGHANAFTEYITGPMVATYKYAANTRLAGYGISLRDTAKGYIVTPHATGVIAYVLQDAVSSNIHAKDLFVAAGDTAQSFLVGLSRADYRNGAAQVVAVAMAGAFEGTAKKVLYITLVRKAQEMMKEVASPADFVAKQYNETVPAFPGKQQVGKVVSAVYNKVTNPQVLVLGGMDAHHAIIKN